MMVKSKSSKRALASIALSFEAFVVFFATLTAFGLKAADISPNLPQTEIIWAIGLTLALLCILTPALLSEPFGYALGWLIQVVVLASGFWLWGMFVIGSIVAGMWIWALVAGGTIDKARANVDKLKGLTEDADPSSN
jgi:hypothetical protein